MKVIVCGSRHISPWLWVQTVKHELVKLKATEVVSGAQRGGDQVGEIAGKQLGLPVKLFPADWDRYGDAAGPIRNRKMAKYAAACIALPGGVGTNGMVRLAREHGLIVVELAKLPTADII